MTTEELRTRLEEILSDRAPEGQEPIGDIQVLEPKFISYSDDGWLTAEFMPRPWQQNGLQVVQGGILGYMIDCIFGPFAYVLSEGRLSGTIDTTCNFLRPVKVDGRPVRVSARFVTNTKRTLHGEAILYNGDGKVAVTASTNMMKQA